VANDYECVQLVVSNIRSIFYSRLITQALETGR